MALTLSEPGEDAVVRNFRGLDVHSLKVVIPSRATPTERCQSIQMAGNGRFENPRPEAKDVARR
jgi:hypothetical protein